MNIFDKIIKGADKFIIFTLIALMAVVLVFATIEVGVIIFNALSNSIKTSNFLLDIRSLTEIFSFFLTVLIGFELFETVKLYLKDNVFHGEVILMVSLIAISRKVIILDYSNEDPLTVIAIAALILSVSAGYYLIKKS